MALSKPNLYSYIKNHPHEIILLFLLIIGAVMRFIHFTDFSLSNDELSALNRVRYDDFSQLVRKGFYVDGHPGGIQVFLYYWVKLFGMSVAAVRFPFVVFGLLVICYSYKTAALWFNKNSGLLVASVLTLTELPLLFSQIARPYGSGMFFTMLMVFYWSKLVFGDEQQKNTFANAAGYVIGAVLCMYNHYFSFLLAFIVGVSGLFLVPRKRLRIYLFSGFSAALLFAPHIPITLNHLSIGGVGEWLGKPEWKWPLEHLFYLHNNSFIFLFLVLGISGWTRIKYPNRINLNKKQVIALIWFVLPMMVGFFYSRWVNPVLQHKVLIFSFPFLFFFLFSFVQKQLSKIHVLYIVLLIAGGLYTTAIENKFYEKQHFGEFRDIAHNILKWNSGLGEENITRIISVNHPFYINYYLDKDEVKTDFALWNIQGRKDIPDIKDVLAESVTPYFVFAATKPVPGEVDHLIRDQYPCVLYRNTYQDRSRITLYARDKQIDTCKQLIDPVRTISNSFELKADLWGKPLGFQSDSIVYEGDYSIFMDGRIYGPTFEQAIKRDEKEILRNIVANVKVFSSDSLNRPALVLDVIDENGKRIMWASSQLRLYIEPGKWSTVSIDKTLPDFDGESCIVKVYVWGHKQESFFFDNLTVHFY